MQKDGLDQLIVFCSLSHHLWKLREELKKTKKENQLSWQKYCSKFLRASALLSLKPDPARNKVGPQGECAQEAEAKTPGDNGRAGDKSRQR